GNHQHRHVLGVGLGDAGKGVLDAGAGLRREHAVAPAALDAAVAVGHADADALLPAQDRPDVERGAGLDQRIARIAGEKLRALALENLGNDFGAVHAFIPPLFDRPGGGPGLPWISPILRSTMTDVGSASLKNAPQSLGRNRCEANVYCWAGA